MFKIKYITNKHYIRKSNSIKIVGFRKRLELNKYNREKTDKIVLIVIVESRKGSGMVSLLQWLQSLGLAFLQLEDNSLSFSSFLEAVTQDKEDKEDKEYMEDKEDKEKKEDINCYKLFPECDNFLTSQILP